jgi:TolB-like protein
VPKRGYRLVELVVPEPVKAESVASIEGKGEPAAPAERTAEAVVLARANVEPFGGPEEGSAAAVSSRDPPPPASAMASVAVLPFENHSIDPTYAFMGDAFATELHGTLARVDRLRVVSRKSSFAFKDANVDVRDIGRKLDVGYVISGSVQCDGVRLYVVAELDDASSGTQIWAQSYARKNDDLLAIEKEIAGAIVASFTTQQLRAEIRNARQASTTNLDAWGLVQRARALALAYTPAGIEDAMEPLRRAIELDPNYAAAHAVLAALLVERLSNGWSPEPRRDGAAALEAAEKALTIAPQDPFILKMASTAWTYAGDYRKALRCLRKAVE